ncbi:UDP-N-acetylmuramate dehydrogenase [Thalassoporum mexicanum PCC 7367]|uniref:UDP-N-acetylmuramate dehydrogenase n=1 Tax=Thalassoporum mexicanum TaxID=3457544 RepID=UPI00029F83F4|nr:UDP-N-acetylmuramate dehydrogenase [Pseudanabaena sp. PCC 7367]AFY69612.1 UDP-N-acetylmuramate dehydrogenase [Pseudanabaena sp. PCC 7367]
MITDSRPTTCIQSSIPLANLTSFRVGGAAEWFCAPRSVDDLQASLAWGDERGLPLTLLGAGSNLLISDEGIDGLVMCLRHFQGLKFDREQGQITAAAGEPIARIAWQAAARGWSGLEWAVGIPGTVGGLVVMNAGAQGSCAADCLANVEVVSIDGAKRIMQPDELEFSYRHSSLQNSNLIVTKATFQLTPGFDRNQVRATTTEYYKYRRLTQPYHLPSCGSVFRNPSPKAAGWLIEQTGLKGYQIGQAQVANLHANFILNCGGASAKDIFRLIGHVQEQVNNQWSLLLKPEVRMLGQF